MANRTITITYAHGQAKIDGVNAAASGQGNTVADGSHVFNIQKFVTESGLTYKVTGFTGTGDFAAGGTGNSVTKNITQDGSLTWTIVQVTKCPSCGADTVAKNLIFAVNTGVFASEKVYCFVCGYDNSELQQFTYV